VITLFTTAKPFKDLSGIIQRNALRSWKLLSPQVEVILFGNEEGAADVCAELGLRHVPDVEKNEVGLKRIDYYFDRAQEMARHDVLCYVNCDILLTSDFLSAIERVKNWSSRFLMVGRRWDTDIRETIDFSQTTWPEKVWRSALAANRQRDEKWIDYFAFPRGLFYNKVPPFVIGRPGWDNWLLWCAADLGADVVDVSDVVRAVHQNHDYSYHPRGEQGVWNDDDAQRNFKLTGGQKHLGFISDATWVMQSSGDIRRRYYFPIQNWRRTSGEIERALIYDVWLPSWHFLLNVTRPLRRVLGLRAKNRR
jgi:hypothetical protein